MALASGTASFQRFSFGGNAPAELSSEWLAAMQSRIFGSMPPQSDDVQVGWIGPRHLFETDLRPEIIGIGAFAHLALRTDRLRTPPAVLRAYIRQEEDAAREVAGRDVLSRAERKRAREAAGLRAEQESRSGAFRRMQSYPVLIDFESRMVLLGGGGALLADRLMHLFYETFSVTLEPLDPERLAARLMLAARNERSLENLQPMRLVNPPSDPREQLERAPLVVGDLAFLGKEFLTWLWFRSDAADASLRVRSGDGVTVMLDRTLRLKCDFGLSGVNTISADGPTQLPEARAALRIGKQPVRAGLVVGGPAGEFRFTLSADRFSINGLTLPNDPAESDLRARLEQRFARIMEATALLDALYESFLGERVSREWARTAQQLTAWVAESGRSPAVRAASA